MHRLLLLFLCAITSHAQEPVAPTRPAISPDLQKQIETAKAAAAARGSLPPGTTIQPGARPGMPGAKPKAAAPAAAKKSKPSATVKRPDKPGTPPNPKEFEAKPDATGLIQFSFQGQPWPPILEWLADVSSMSLNWEELPGGYLNLTTRRAYTLAEARDLINGHLITRGFTLVVKDGTMQVISIKDLSTAAIPRLTPEQLEGRQPNEFVRVSFRLDWLIAESVVSELKPMLGKHGRLHQLATTNRVEAIDTVANLQAVHQLLKEEQSDTGQQRLIRPFVLKHRRAVDVIDLVKELVGIQKSATKPAAAANNPMAQQQAMMRAMQAQGQAGGKKKPKSPEPEVHLVLNQRENSILAHAPPNKMAEIEQAIKAIDLPGDDANPMLLNPERMQVYHLTSFKPKPFVELLNEVGDLDPRTQLKIDEENNAVIAYASLADHVAIRMMMKQLDGSIRKFEVVKLVRLEAAYVAGTIQFMMTEKDEDTSSSRNRSFSFGYDPFGSRSTPKKNKDKFKVDADVENNRLLLWANEVELGEIRNLLAKLGEDPNSTGREDLIRVFDVSQGQTPAQLIEQVEKLWHLDNPIQIVPQPATGKAAENQTPAAGDATTTRTPMQNSGVVRTQMPATGQSKISNPAPDDAAAARFFRELNADLKSPTPNGTSQSLEPVRLSVRSDGMLVVTSRDPDALRNMEELLAKLAPQRRDYKIFRLKHSAPLGVSITLEDFFEDPSKGGSGVEYDPFFGFMPSKKKEQTDVRLSRRRIPRFIPDNYTSTILVQGADRGQLETIAQLIELYDQPEPTDSRSLRMTKMFQIKHSKATIIANAIKDVFRDLLSDNDKALGDQKKDTSSERIYTYLDGGADEDEEESPVKFKGLLSIGVDEYSNTLIVSSTSGLLDTIGQLIDGLDQAAQPRGTEFKVHRLSPDVDPALLQKRLEKLFTKPAKEPGKPKPKPGKPGVPPGAQTPGT